MSTKRVEIRLGGWIVGEWTFNEAPNELVAERTSEGFRAELPSRVTLRMKESGHLWPMVSGLRARVHVDGSETLDLGIATDFGLYQGTSPQSEVDARLEWRGTIETLQQFEKIRNGGPATLVLDCQAEVCQLYAPNGVPPLRSIPELVRGSVRITYAKETWVHTLNRLNAMATILVEFPLRPSPPSPWDEVWKALHEAQESFAQGGSTGWKGCVVSIRHALEQWREIDQEREDMGPGWKAPSVPDRESRTRKQRMDNLRWHLMQCAHLAAHSPAEDWTRDDAAALLATLAGLLALRNP